MLRVARRPLPRAEWVKGRPGRWNQGARACGRRREGSRGTTGAVPVDYLK